MRRAYGYGVLLLSAMGLVGCAQPGAVEKAKQSSTAGAVVTMNGFNYAPKRVTIKTGQTVQWTNTDAILKHTVTADPKLAKTASSVALPAGAMPFDSGMLKPSQTFMYTFTTPGTYKYFCIPHERMGMVGEVEVQP